MQKHFLYRIFAAVIENTASIGNRIKDVRSRLNMSQEEFAGKLDISRSVLSQIEIDKIRPSVELITRIVRDFNEDYRWLMEGSGGSQDYEDRRPGQSIIESGKIILDTPSQNSERPSKRPKSLFSKFTQYLEESSGESMDFTEANYTHRIRQTPEDLYRDREMPLITGYEMEAYPRERENKAFLNKLSWMRLPTDPNRKYRAFAIPDMRLSPFLEKGDILVGYLVEDTDLLAPMSYYILVTEKRVIFGMIQEISGSKEIVLTENPLMQKPQRFKINDVKEFWLVDKLITDNFVSRFRYLQMMMQNMGLGNMSGISFQDK